jgi:carbon-monoxide dehydrogenase iron sulfur subunit
MEKIILVNPEKCVGCEQCSLSCSFTKEKFFSLGKARVKTFWVCKKDMFLPISCQHCEKPLCLDACPTGAISRNENTGAIVIEDEKCNGCKACMEICPFDALIWGVDRGCVVKCDLCGGDPECVKHCLYGALSWVEADEGAISRKQLGVDYFAEVMAQLKGT